MPTWSRGAGTAALGRAGIRSTSARRRRRSGGLRLRGPFEPSVVNGRRAARRAAAARGSACRGLRLSRPSPTTARTAGASPDPRRVPWCGARSRACALRSFVRPVLSSRERRAVTVVPSAPGPHSTLSISARISGGRPALRARRAAAAATSLFRGWGRQCLDLPVRASMRLHSHCASAALCVLDRVRYTPVRCPTSSRTLHPRAPPPPRAHPRRSILGTRAGTEFVADDPLSSIRASRDPPGCAEDHPVTSVVRWCDRTEGPCPTTWSHKGSRAEVSTCLLSPSSPRFATVRPQALVVNCSYPRFSLSRVTCQTSSVRSGLELRHISVV